MLRVLDPSYIAEHQETINSASVRELSVVVPLAAARGGALLTELERNLPAYLAAANGFTTNHGSADEFTGDVLGWYKTTEAR